MIRAVIELILSLMLVVTSADLIYLYFVGGWQDPIKAIEIAELSILSLFVIGGITYAIWRWRLNTLV